MQLFLIRHAIAVERSEGLDDTARPLTEKGRRRFAMSVGGLERLKIQLDQVFHSPWLRAVQTAELLAPITVGRRQTTELLATDPGPSLLDLAGWFDSGSRIAFVGHEPWMGEFLSLCLTGTTEHGEALPFKKGAVAWLTGDPVPGGLELTAMLPPRPLRRLALEMELSIELD